MCAAVYREVYMRENGQLLYAGPDTFLRPCFKLYPHLFVIKPRFENEPPVILQQRDHFICTYEEWGMNYSVRPLFDISLRFVAAHVEDVDTLAGFPEQIAHQVFVAARERRKFTDPSTSFKALQVFTKAYGKTVLKTLCFRDRGFLVRERVKELQVFHHLESLDLYGCSLGDNHELYQHITSEAFNRLVKLFLGDNSLSNRGLQRLTAPIRVMKKGLENLQHLDLSSNPLTEKGLGYLTCFKKLQDLDISDTGLEVDASLKSFLEAKLGMVYSAKQLPVFSHYKCKTEGWAKEVIDQWGENFSHISVNSLCSDSAKRFYKQDTISQEINYRLCSNSDCGYKTLIIHFHKPDPHSMSQQAGHSEDPHDQTAQTRLSEQKEKLPCRKCKPEFWFIDEDFDLLNSY